MVRVVKHHGSGLILDPAVPSANNFVQDVLSASSSNPTTGESKLRTRPLRKATDAFSPARVL
jgi:hypothetical protein